MRKLIRNTNISARENSEQFTDYRTNFDPDIGQWVKEYVDNGGIWYDILGPFETKRAELISGALGEGNIQGKYEVRYYDLPRSFLNFIIFEYSDEYEAEEVLFGFGLHGRDEQPVFSSTAPEIVSEFKSLYASPYNYCDSEPSPVPIECRK